jgi:SAM-dependent methyltransferase
VESEAAEIDGAARARYRRTARERLGAGLAGLFLKQAWAEFRVTVRGRLRFRDPRNAGAVRAYRAMSVADFEGINARQKWANWRVIPRNLHGRLPDRPCRAVDLCSGVGDSTEVLACCLPPGSEVLGLECSAEFVRAARGRVILDGAGRPMRAEFRAQSVLDTFRDAAGRALADGSVDLVNCCGAAAINFTGPEVAALAAEIARVLRPGGLAAIDAPARASGQARMVRAFGDRFDVVGAARSCFLDRFTQICFRRRTA